MRYHVPSSLERLGAGLADEDTKPQRAYGESCGLIVHHYLMRGWGLEDTPKPAVLLADQVELAAT